MTFTQMFEASAQRVRDRFVVIDRNDLPEVVPDELNGTFHVGGVRYTGRDREDIYLGRARRDIAMAEYLRAHPPVDEKAVDELADTLRDAIPDMYGSVRKDLARRLVADGWKREVGS